MIVSLNANALITAVELDTFLQTIITDYLVINKGNKYFDFNIGGAELNATIAEGTYPIGNTETESGSFCEAVYDAIVAAEAAGTYTVRVVSDLITITRSAGTFQILWKTGVHGSDNTDDHIGTLAGYDDTADDTGALFYIADNAIGRSYSNTLINFASDFIEKYCNRVLIAVDYSEEAYDGNGEKELYVKNPPINSVTKVESWDTYNNVTSQEYSEHTEFMIYGEEGYIYMRGSWWKGKRNYRLTYNGGFSTIPYDLKKACADLCSLMKEQKDKIGVKSEKIGTYAISLGDGGTVTIGGLAIPAVVLSLLVNYRIINI